MKKKVLIGLLLCIMLTVTIGCSDTKKTSENKLNEVPDNIVAMDIGPNKPTFMLSSEEQLVFDLFKVSKDDTLLMDLEPISIAKFYIEALLNKDYETQYALYYTEDLGEGGMGWTLEEYLKIPEKDRGTEDFIYKSLTPLANGEFIQTEEDFGYIKYERVEEGSSEAINMGFQMKKGENNIWKVCFMSGSVFDSLLQITWYVH